MIFVRTFLRLVRDDRAATVVEYGMILAGIFLLMIGAASALGDQQTRTFNGMSSAAAGAMAGTV